MVPLIIAGLAVLGVGAIVLNWDEIKSWLRSISNTIKELWQQYKPYAKKVAAVIAERYEDNGHPMVRIIYKLFLKEKLKKWKEIDLGSKATERQVEYDDLPIDVANRLRNSNKADITDIMENELY